MRHEKSTRVTTSPSFREELELRDQVVTSTSWYKCQPHMALAEHREGGMAAPVGHLEEGLQGTQNLPHLAHTLVRPGRDSLLIQRVHFLQHLLLFPF